MEKKPPVVVAYQKDHKSQPPSSTDFVALSCILPAKENHKFYGH